MSVRVAMMANTLCYPEGGGHMWVYLNWALGLRAAGCEVIWLEGVAVNGSVAGARAGVGDPRARLAPDGPDQSIAPSSRGAGEPHPRLLDGALGLGTAPPSGPPPD